MDRLGEVMAQEIKRLKLELKRQRAYTYEARKSRDIWKRRAQERQAQLQYRRRYRGITYKEAA